MLFLICEEDTCKPFWGRTVHCCVPRHRCKRATASRLSYTHFLLLAPSHFWSQFGERLSLRYDLQLYNEVLDTRPFQDGTCDFQLWCRGSWLVTWQRWFLMQRAGSGWRAWTLKTVWAQASAVGLELLDQWSSLRMAVLRTDDIHIHSSTQHNAGFLDSVSRWHLPPAALHQLLFPFPLCSSLPRQALSCTHKHTMPL